MRKIFACLLLLGSCHLLCAQKSVLKNDHWYLRINEDGTLDSLAIHKKDQWAGIPIQHGKYKGFSFHAIYADKNEEQQSIVLTKADNYIFSGKINDIKVFLQYAIEQDKLKITAGVENTGLTPFTPQSLGLKTGISNYMMGYPQWNDVYFPTMLRCEKTHFTGYLESPKGEVLAISSPDAVASYSLDYNFGYGSGKNIFFGHRIYTFNLDLLNAKPLPSRHPQDLYMLAPGQKKKWTFYLKDVSKLNIPHAFFDLTHGPAFNIPLTSQEEGKLFNFEVYSDDLKLIAETPTGRKLNIGAGKGPNGIYKINFSPQDGPGVYTFKATDSQGKITESRISVLKPFGWYIQMARLGALKYTQKASWNCENWYGFYSTYIAQKYFPNDELNEKTDERFRLVMSLLYDTANNWMPIQLPNRIQNHSTTIGILVSKYLAQKNIGDLKAAKDLANWIIDHAQSEDGAYRSNKTHYTSVIYIAKSIMELMEVEKKLAADNVEWAKAYEKHYKSVKRAIDQLTKGFGAVDTEGELTFEDGMISCSALQIAAFALLQTDIEKRNFYIEAAKKFLSAHECLEQTYIPDSRMRGGTLRFWEAQYDVLIGHNFMNSPHGWSAWTTYASYYMYLLTGEEKYLLQTMNAIGSGMQLVDFKTGDLYWAFCADPYIKTIQSRNFEKANPDSYNDNQYSPYEGVYDSLAIGEQYVNMIADKFNANSSDNDVHEQFKCAAEIVLTKAYILERKDGSILSYNCQVKKDHHNITIIPNESNVSSVHLNLQNPSLVKVLWNKTKPGVYNAKKGLQEIRLEN